ncbi:MAG: D-glycero-beta-D-manno-heptose 1-phosphate adenylyltransferase [Candidatus Aminicenantes bacterium]|nr:D-glycero-beta-D-manno-heptose 1-phosphate adenylyltransferase [Candidatus Aminicenantes bacterium]
MHSQNAKLKSVEELLLIRKSLKNKGKTMVMTNGCFDILHGGHIHLFKQAKKKGDVLVVALNDDSSIKKIKGPHRPVFKLAERIEILAAVEFIDYLVSFQEETPEKLISLILPHVLVKGGDWTKDQIVGRKEVESAGGQVVSIPYLPGSSSTEVIERILRIKT